MGETSPDKRKYIYFIIFRKRHFSVISELPIRGTSTHIPANDGMHSIPTFAASDSRIKCSRSCIAEFQIKDCRLAAENKVNMFIKYICPLPYPIFVIPQ
jgi:hypothetical protein